MSPFKSEPKALPYGPVMIDIVGLELTDHDRERLCHPLVGGLILFARNYQSPEQLQRLTAEVHALRTPQLPIAIDHEGGRVQRCREGFTRLPAMRSLGARWETNPTEAIEAARSIGFVLAALPISPHRAAVGVRGACRRQLPALPAVTPIWNSSRI